MIAYLAVRTEDTDNLRVGRGPMKPGDLWHNGRPFTSAIGSHFRANTVFRVLNVGTGNVLSESVATGCRVRFATKSGAIFTAQWQEDEEAVKRLEAVSVHNRSNP
jgi:hypothetical protein